MSYPGWPPPNCWQRSAMRRRNVLRTRLWSLDSFCTRGKADGTDLWTPLVVTVMMAQEFEKSRVTTNYNYGPTETFK